MTSPPGGGSEYIADYEHQAYQRGQKEGDELIKQMRERVPQVVEAIKKGIQTYEDVDEGNAIFGVQA
ncbi:hypothetical protein ABT324_18360 [Saccharopolyspora sp. NPDC000359]|uniref:hypothetical protein n=1 Tax=Saccharopolyspora sp. NPDC000359 TaxID=3154251 RepID=UPI0033219F6F